MVGGDLVRINGLEFLVADRDSYEQLAREAAVQDALDKALQYARLTGVTLGPPLVIEESGLPYGGSYTPMLRSEALAGMGANTPISEGQSSVSAAVDIIFAIQ